MSIGSSKQTGGSTPNNSLISFVLADQIKIDLPRTFPGNDHFEHFKQGLYNVLIAYAHHNQDVGYCQGLNYIAGE